MAEPKIERYGSYDAPEVEESYLVGIDDTLMAVYDAQTISQSL